MALGPPPTRVSGPAPAPLRCRECGERRTAEARFCANCGASSTYPPAQVSEMRVSIGVGSGFRFGAGFFLAAAVFGVVSFLASLLVAGTLVGALFAGIGGLTSTGASTFEGSGNAISQPQRLSGDVEIAWTASDQDGGGCQIRAAVARADRPIAREAILDLAIATQDRGTYALRGLSDADYTIDVASDCGWTFRVTR